MAVPVPAPAHTVPWLPISDAAEWLEWPPWGCYFLPGLRRLSVESHGNQRVSRWPGGTALEESRDFLLTGCKFSREHTLLSLALPEAQSERRVRCRQKNAWHTV